MKLILFSILSITVLACSSNQSNTLIKDIKNLESSKNLSGSDSLINTYIRFADGFPEHDSAAIYVFKAAQLCIKSNKIVKGARLYERIALEYKSHPIAPDALIRGGTAFATVPDPANAKRLYDMFISNYPDHKRIEEVKMWSYTSGMSEDELMRFFKSEILNQDTIKVQ